LSVRDSALVPERCIATIRMAVRFAVVIALIERSPAAASVPVIATFSPT